MKLKSHTVDRKGDKVTITADWADRFRQPAVVTIETSKRPEGDPRVLITGDVKDVDGVIQGIAEMAWAGGWRPRGLDGALVHMLKAYKPPVGEPR